MEDYSKHTREQLIARIHHLENLTEAYLEEKEKEELLNFSWTGNLGHWYWDYTNNTVTHNPLKVEALGYHRNEVPNDIGFQFFTEKLHPDDYERVMQVMREHLRGERAVYEVAYRIQTKEGQWKYFYDRGKVTRRDEQGNPIFLAGIVFDITEKKETEKELEEKNRQLEEAVRTRDKFFSIISHDLKNGFQHLVGIPDMLLRRYDRYTNDKLREMIGLLRDEAESTFALLENLFEWSKSQRGALTFQPEWLNLEAVVEDAFDDASNQANTKNIELSHHLESSRIYADPNMLRTVFRNLLNNAIKFSPEGSMVSVESKADQDMVTIEVTDQGVGIPGELRERLFQIDQDVSRPGTNEEKGNGLGLVVCREFIHKHGGEIRVDPKRKQGTRIVFTIPRKPVAAD